MMDGFLNEIKGSIETVRGMVWMREQGIAEAREELDTSVANMISMQSGAEVLGGHLAVSTGEIKVEPIVQERPVSREALRATKIIQDPVELARQQVKASKPVGQGSHDS
jgi:hypothetical protein